MSSGIRRKGKVKWFNVVKGYGFIVPEDGQPDVFVHQNVIHMEGFRSLDENEEVEFESHDTDKGVEATLVTGPEGKDCKGSTRRPVPKRRPPRIRCYNCGRFSDHIAAKCPFAPQGVSPKADPNHKVAKQCYHCKSDSHLLRDCPDAPPPTTEQNNNATGGRGRKGASKKGDRKRDKDGNDDNAETVANASSHEETTPVTEMAELTINANGDATTTPPPLTSTPLGDE